MTLVEAEQANAGAGPGPAGPRPAWARAWALPVWAHLLALGAVLLLLVPVVGASQVFLPDEGAAILQARSLAAGDGWIVEHPLAEVDPEGAHYPIVHAERGSRGSAPLAKHPAYAVLAAAAFRLAGVAGIVVLSLMGTVAAAGLAAALARRLDPSLARPAVWAVGLASPLLFDGFLAMAHTLGAALAAGAVLAAVVAVEDRRPAAALAVLPCIAGAALLRNEAVLFGLALALVAAAAAAAAAAARGARPARRLPAVTVAVALASLVGAVGAHLVDRAWVARITGEPVASTGAGLPAAADSFVRGRVEGFRLTWLTPGYDGSPALVFCLLAMAVAVAAGAVRARSHPGDGGGVLTTATAAALAAVAALAVAPDNIVPGLLLAFPLLLAGLASLRSRVFAEPGAAIAGATAGLFAVAVVLTQYSVGGSGEWGGRYFALALPSVVPVLLFALRLQGLTLSPPVRRGVVAALVVCSAALSTMAVTGLRANHQVKAALVERIEAAGRATGDSRPVVLTTWVAGARSAWPTFDDHRWLYVRAADVGAVAERLQAAAVDRVVLVTADLESDRAHLGGVEVVSVDGPPDRLGRQVLVLRTD